MTTTSWSSRIRHDSDATFREWGSELNTRLAAAGLVQTADTGQINWVTVTRPAINTDAGYEIWRFNDSLQGTSPIFLRIAYGTGSANAAAPRIGIAVGTGTNGAGTLTGTLSSGDQIHITSGSANTTDTARASYACHTEGSFGLAWKVGSNTEGAFNICRTVDSNGTPTGDAIIIRWGASSTTQANRAQWIRLSGSPGSLSNQTSTGQQALAFNAGVPTGSAIGGDVQAYLCWALSPRMVPVTGMCGVYASELPSGNTFQATLVGATQRTYLTMGGQAGPVSHTTTNPLIPAMLWE